jgi:hypothetical protein
LIYFYGRGANVEYFSVDVRENEKMKEILLKMDLKYQIDLSIVNAAVTTCNGFSFF